MDVLGIDVGGSGIKGAMIHMETGEMLSPRYRIPTPESRKPDEMAEVVAGAAFFCACRRARTSAATSSTSLSISA